MNRFDDNFDRRFDAHFDRMDKMGDNLIDHPVRTFLGMGLVVILLNLIFWGVLIGGTIWAVSAFLL